MPDYNDINIPTLNLSWNKSDKKDFALLFEEKNFNQEIFTQEKQGVHIKILGCPILEDKINLKKVANTLFEKGVDKNFIKTINGQFLIFLFSEKKQELTIINDRFCAFSFFYADFENEFLGSFLYQNLFKKLKNKKDFQLNKKAMFEFIYFQKVQHNKTYDNFSKFLLPASILKVSKEKILLENYFTPDFKKRKYKSKKQAGDIFVSLLKKSIKRQTSDNKKYGLFLSGGFDSRIALSAFENPPNCITIGFLDNYEVDISRKVAMASNAKHKYIELPKNHYEKIITPSSKIAGGLYANSHAHFLGIKEEIKEDANVMFHGHGFDYFFQGMYMPKKTIHLFNRPTFFKKSVEIKGDIVSFFIENISFRNKAKIKEFIKSNQKEEIEKGLYDNTKQVIEEANAKVYNNDDKFEYLLTHGLSRHYSYPNLTSMMTNSEQRILCFDNDIYDFYLSLDKDLRVSNFLPRYALKKMNKKLANISSANFGIPIAASAFFQTSWLIIRKILRHLTGIKTLHTPHAQDRTWPDRDDYIRNYENYKNEIITAINSKELEQSLDFFDWEKIRKQTKVWFGKEKGGAKFLISLLSIYKLIKD